MENASILKSCVDQAERLKRQIQNDCRVPSNCLGGQMCGEYEKVRAHQLAIIRNICAQLHTISQY